MKRWPTKPLGEVCSVNPKLAASDAPAADAEVTFVPMAAVDEVSGTIAQPENRRYSEVAKGYTPFRENDVLFAKITPCMQNGKAAVAINLCNGFGFGSTEFHVLRSTGSVLPRWVFTFIRQPAFRDAAKGSFTGSAGQQRVPSDFLKAFPIPVPPLSEQERIVKLLDEADELRKLRTQADHRTGALIPALFHETFGDSAENPKRWPLKMLGDITKIDAPMVDPRLEEYLDLPHVGPERIEGETGKLLPTKTAREDALVSGKFLFDRRHVLYSKIRPYLRKVALPDFRGLCSADVYPVTPVQSEICREYLWAVLLSESFMKYTAGHDERANIPKVNREQFNAYKCPLPPLSLQKDFAARVAEVRALQVEQASSRHRLDGLFQSLLHRAFNGEL